MRTRPSTPQSRPHRSRPPPPRPGAPKFGSHRSRGLQGAVGAPGAAVGGGKREGGRRPSPAAAPVPVIELVLGARQRVDHEMDGRHGAACAPRSRGRAALARPPEPLPVRGAHGRRHRLLFFLLLRVPKRRAASAQGPPPPRRACVPGSAIRLGGGGRGGGGGREGGSTRRPLGRPRRTRAREARSAAGGPGGAGADAASGEGEQPAARVTGDEPPPPAPPPPSSLLPQFLRLAGLGADRRGGGGGAEGGASGRGPARGAGLRETGGRAAAIGRLNVVGPRRCKALAYWRAGPRARPSPRLGGRGCAFRGARARSGRRGGRARAPGWHFGLADPDGLPVLLVLWTRQGALGSRDARPLGGGRLRKRHLKTGERGSWR